MWLRKTSKPQFFLFLLTSTVGVWFGGGYRVLLQNLNKSEKRKTKKNRTILTVPWQPHDTFSAAPLMSDRKEQKWEGSSEVRGGGRTFQGNEYWPPPSAVPVGLRSPTGCAVPSWSPWSRACHCWAGWGCLLALLLTGNAHKKGGNGQWQKGVRFASSKSSRFWCSRKSLLVQPWCFKVEEPAVAAGDRFYELSKQPNAFISLKLWANQLRLKPPCIVLNIALFIFLTPSLQLVSYGQQSAVICTQLQRFWVEDECPWS